MTREEKIAECEQAIADCEQAVSLALSALTLAWVHFDRLHYGRDSGDER
jgi:hypothetical protein